MKSLLLGLLLSAACASNHAYVNVATVRNDINASIARDASTGQTTSRFIVSMGHTTNDTATVFTQTAKGAPRREETWIRVGGHWKLQGSKDVADTGAPPATAN